MAKENAFIEESKWLSEEGEDSFDFDELEMKLQSQLEEELADLEFSKEEKEKIGNPDELGKIILDEVWKQFGNQIGLDMTSETLIQEYDRKHPEESQEYNADEGAKILRDKKYKDTREEMKRKQEEGTLKDDYTGKDLNRGDDFDVEHVVKRKEIHENKRRKQAGLEASELANKDENMKSVNASLNRSIKEKSNKEYVEKREQREKDLIEKNERRKKKIDDSNKSDVEKRLEKEKEDKRLQNKLDADDELMMKADDEARKAINKDIAKGAIKKTVGKAGKDALKAMAVSSLFSLLKEIMNGFVRYLKSQAKSLKKFLEEMKKAIKSFFGKISNVLHAGASSALGTIMTEIFGTITSVFKKMSSLIKQSFSSVMKAIEYLRDKENKNKPFSIKIAEIGKIITVGLVAAGAVLGGEAFEKLLLSVPGMQIQLPLIGSLANVIGMFLASLISGVIGAIGINCIDKFIAKKQRSEAQKDIIEKGNQVIATQQKYKIINEGQLERDKEVAQGNILDRHKEASMIMRGAYSKIMEDFVEDFSGDDFEDFSGNDFEDFSGDDFEDFSGNDFEDFSGNDFEDFSGNDFEDFSGNDFEDFSKEENKVVVKEVKKSEEVDKISKEIDKISDDLENLLTDWT